MDSSYHIKILSSSPSPSQMLSSLPYLPGSLTTNLRASPTYMLRTCYLFFFTRKGTNYIVFQFLNYMSYSPLPIHYEAPEKKVFCLFLIHLHSCFIELFSKIVIKDDHIFFTNFPLDKNIIFIMAMDKVIF